MRGVQIFLPLALLGGAAFAQEQPAMNPPAGSAERVVTDSNPFIGTWELDPARTKLGARTVRMEPAGDSVRMVTPMGQYTFKIDGNDYPTNDPGSTTNWKQIDSSTWEVTAKENGKVASTSRHVMSADGNRIATTTTIQGEQPATINSVYERQGSATEATGDSPAAKLFGSWKQNRQVQATGTAPTLTYEATANGMRAHYRGMGTPQEYDIRLDGQEHAVEGAPGYALTTRKLDDHTFEEVWQRDGKPFSKSSIRVSADGRELTEAQDPGSSEVESSEYVYKRK
jgi:hypothetical protein